ncbi:MAG: EamA family transporter [Pyrinomonadaceae bacterium]
MDKEIAETDNDLRSAGEGGSLSPYLFVLVAVLIWSTGGVFIKITTIDAFSVNFGRSLFATFTVGIYLAFRKALRINLFSILAGIFYASTLTSFVYANKNTTAANAIFLQYTAPVYILAVAPFLLREKFRFFDLITVVSCLVGMSLFFMDSGTTGGTSSSSGIVAGLISGFSLGMYFILLRHPKAYSSDPALSVLIGNVIIVLAMLPFLAAKPPVPTLNDYLAISYLGIVQIGIAYILFTRGVANGVRSLDASIIGFVEPLLNPVWVVLIVGEVPSVWTITGGAVIIAAVLFHTLLQSRIKSRPARPQ